MADSEAGPKDSPRPSLNLVAHAALVLVILAVVAGAVTLVVRQFSPDDGLEVVLPTAVPQSNVVLKVYLTGAVVSPGVYAVVDGDRLIDVIAAAGGATEQADLAATNLAVRVKDQDHWHVPSLGEEPASQTTLSDRTSGRIDLNSADAEVLVALPGIGEVKAEAIIRYREGSGPFASIEELLAVQGIGAVTLESIRDLVEVR